MSDIRPAADPELLGAAFPKTGKPFTGSPEVIDHLIARVTIAAHRFAVDSRNGFSPAAVMPPLLDEVKAVTAAITGKSDAYEAVEFQRDGTLADFLREKYGLGDDDDPVETILLKLAHDTVKLYRDYEMGHIDDKQSELGVAALKLDAARDMLALPALRDD